MTSFFDDLRRIRDDVTFETLSHLRLGTSVTCSVTEVTDFGLQVDSNGVRGLIPQSVLIGLQDETVYEVGDNLSAVVVFIDYQFSVVELSPGKLEMLTACKWRTVRWFDATFYIIINLALRSVKFVWGFFKSLIPLFRSYICAPSRWGRQETSPKRRLTR